jgi:sortase A
LEIPRLAVSAAVLEGDDDRTPKVAVGHLLDTALPWEDGNMALAGHRDTFFRPLEQLRVGDDVHVATRHGEFEYRVRRLAVVDPENVWVLNPSQHVDLTLITCYPFRYVGPAPKRYIVQAERLASGEYTFRR